MKKLPKWLEVFSAVFVMVLLAAGAVAAVRPVFFSEEAVAVFFPQEQPAETCGFCPRVVDGETGLPIENAVVILPETNERFLTDREGQTGEIRLPYREETRFSALSRTDWAETTLLVYADGYVPYALFYLQLRQNELRSGPTVMLFRGDEEKPFSIIEGPPEAWVKKIVKRYHP